MEIAPREAEYGPCPYLEGRSWRVQEFGARTFDPALYESMLAEGWRRSGSSFYRTACSGCASCIPIRLDADSFVPTKSQRRLIRLNADVEVSLEPPTFSRERFALYARYQRYQHGSVERSELVARHSYEAFLLESPLGTTMISDYRLKADGSLVATGYVDLLPSGISSVYFAFDPSAAKRSLGVWSVLRELALAKEHCPGDALGKCYYYLGFWIPGSPKMDYKANFHPFEYAREGRWLAAKGRDLVAPRLREAS
jgi:arginine-tRNA-protein transferase